MRHDLFAVIATVLLLAGTASFSAAAAYEPDGNGKAVARWSAQQAVSPQNDISNAFADAKDGVCNDRTSDECRIGGAAIDGAHLLVILPGLLGTFAVIRGLLH